MQAEGLWLTIGVTSLPHLDKVRKMLEVTSHGFTITSCSLPSVPKTNMLRALSSWPRVSRISHLLNIHHHSPSFTQSSLPPQDLWVPSPRGHLDRCSVLAATSMSTLPPAPRPAPGSLEGRAICQRGPIALWVQLHANLLFWLMWGHETAGEMPGKSLSPAKSSQTDSHEILFTCTKPAA